MGIHRIKYFFAGLIPVCVLSLAAETLTLAPGQLAGKLSQLPAGLTGTLTLEGRVEASELRSLSGLPSTVSSLDMSALYVTGCAMGDSGSDADLALAEGELPPFMLTGLALRHVALPCNTVRIGEAALAGTAVESLILPSTLREIGDYALYGCSELRVIDMSQTKVTTVGKGAFMHSGIVSLALNSLESAGEYAFADMKNMTDISFPAGARLSEGAFFGDTSLEYLPLTSHDQAIVASGLPNLAFTVNINSEEVAHGALAGSSAKIVAFGSNVRKIDSKAFMNMKGVERFVVASLGSNPPEVADDAFQGVNQGGVLLVTTPGTEDAWRAAPVWRDFKITNYETDSVELMADTAQVSASRSGGTLTVTSAFAVDSVEVFSTAGLRLASAKGSGNEVTLSNLPEDGVLVVRTVSGGMLKVTKVL